MDKYQKVLLETEKTSVFFTCTSKKNSLVLNGGFNYDADVYTLTQEEDIFSTKYEFVVKTNPNIETCTFLVNGEWQSASRKGSAFSVELDFENRVEKVKLTFADNIVDDYTFSVQYVEADKDLYYQKKAATKRARYIESARIKYATGADLVNIYFQPCSYEYQKTEIALYKDGMMLANYKVDEECFFKSITGLAYGKYSFVLKQFDSNNQELFETDKISFSITSPQQPIMGHINRI